jgi:hypothetical protein
MNNTALRVRGWISALRPFALLGLVLGLLFGIAVGINLYQANRAANSPQIEIGQLLRGEIGPNDYVTITGFVVYGGGFTETEGEKIVAAINPVIDMNTGELIFVRFTQAELLTKEGEETITVSGRTAVPEDELARLIEGSITELESVGLSVTSDQYIKNVVQPGQINRAWLQIGAIGAAMVLCAAIYAMPAIVFNPEPLSAASPSPVAGLVNMQVTGKLFKASKKDIYQATKRRQHFAKAYANLIRLDPNGLMVHVHQVVRHRSYGITVGKTESDWLVKLYPHQVVKVEPGKLYTFNQRWAVRFVYKTEDDKESVLVVNFENDQDQAAFISLLKEMGFAVQTLGYANTI